MEYTITGFAPVILASVSATTMNRIMFDAEPVFKVPAFELATYLGLPIIVVMGAAVDGFAVGLLCSGGPRGHEHRLRHCERDIAWKHCCYRIAANTDI